MVRTVVYLGSEPERTRLEPCLKDRGCLGAVMRPGGWLGGDLVRPVSPGKQMMGGKPYQLERTVVFLGSDPERTRPEPGLKNRQIRREVLQSWVGKQSCIRRG
eukprot:scaffold4894_cov16-Prasinocladus_malaysianus.AAC.2